MSKVEVRNLRGTQLMGVARDHALIFDKTVEGGGTGLGINASELFLFSLGACMTFNLLQYAATHQMKIRDIRVDLSDEQQSSPNRIVRVKAQVHISGEVNDDELLRLLRSAKGCKIHNTLKAVPEVEVSVHKAGPQPRDLLDTDEHR
jgi:putative redox protein